MSSLPSPSSGNTDVPLSPIRCAPLLPDSLPEEPTITTSTSSNLNLSSSQPLKKRSPRKKPLKLPHAPSSSSSSTGPKNEKEPAPTTDPIDEKETTPFWISQGEQMQSVVIQGWNYLVQQWKKTRISKGIIDYWSMHMIYLFFLGLSGAVVIFIGENSKVLGGVDFIDCFFLAVSAITGTGLTVLPFNDSTRVTTICCYVLMTIGSNIMLSIPPVLLRRYLYRQSHPNEFQNQESNIINPPIVNVEKLETENTLEYTGRKMYQAMSETVSKFTPYVNEFKKLGSLSSLSNDEMNATISSKTEYHAAGLLLRLYLFYILGTQMIGFLIIGSYAQFNPGTRTLLQSSNLNPWSWSLFHVSSCFYNSGFSLIPDSLKNLYDENTIIVTSVFLIILGNCLFPITLRWVILVMHKSPWFSKKTKKCATFLIKHPRRASIHLFEDRETWILLMSWIAGNVFQVAFSLAFDMQRLPFLGFSQFKQVGVFFFQAFSNRTSGFYIVDLNLYSKVIQVIWIFIMIMDSYPLLLTIRYTGSSSKKKKEDSSLEKMETKDKVLDPVAPSNTPTVPSLYLGNIDDHIVPAPPITSSKPLPSSSSNLPLKETFVNNSDAPLLASSNLDEVNELSISTNALQPVSIPPQSPFVSQPNTEDNEHILKQWVLRDVACIYIFLLLILIAETPWSEAGAPTDGLNMDLWMLVFEVTSAYSTVGLSLDNITDASIASTFTTFSKLVMILTMLLGRTRSVPSTIDYSFAPPEETAPKEQVFILSSAMEEEDDDLFSDDNEEVEETVEEMEVQNENEGTPFKDPILTTEQEEEMSQPTNKAIPLDSNHSKEATLIKSVELKTQEIPKDLPV